MRDVYERPRAQARPGAGGNAEGAPEGGAGSGAGGSEKEAMSEEGTAAATMAGVVAALECIEGEDPAAKARWLVGEVDRLARAAGAHDAEVARLGREVEEEQQRTLEHHKAYLEELGAGNAVREKLREAEQALEDERTRGAARAADLERSRSELAEVGDLAGRIRLLLLGWTPATEAPEAARPGQAAADLKEVHMQVAYCWSMAGGREGERLSHAIARLQGAAAEDPRARGSEADEEPGHEDDDGGTHRIEVDLRMRNVPADRQRGIVEDVARAIEQQAILRMCQAGLAWDEPWRIDVGVALGATQAAGGAR